MRIRPQLSECDIDKGGRGSKNQTSYVNGPQPCKAVSALRVGGRYLIAGMVTPGCDLGIDGNLLIRKCLTVKGIHNYRPGTIHI